MCGGVEYRFHGENFKTYFPNPASTLPVKTADGDVMQIPWGRRQQQAGRLPLGGWARLESIYGGRWDRFSPVPVQLPVDRFMEKDHEGTSHWYEITNGQVIQGLVARLNHERRVYVVTIEPKLEDAIHERWPRIVNVPTNS